MIQQLRPQIIQPAMKKACPILDSLLRAGFSAYFVGGAVRDTLLGKHIHDIDIATSAQPEQVLELFLHCIPTGLQHGTVTVVQDDETYEVTTYRADAEYTDFRRPSEVVFVDELEQDLQRRDFTMNAMAIDINWKLYDPYGGQTDLHNGVLSTVGKSEERFQEDALRMLRALRFSLTYHLRMTDECQQAIWKHGRLLRHIAMERVANELSRMLQGAACADVVSQLQQSKLLSFTKEQLYIAQYQPVASLIKLDKFKQQGDASTIAESVHWSLLFLAFGMSSEQAASDLKALRLSNQLHDEVCTYLKLTEWLQANSEHTLNEALKQQWLNMLLVYPLQLLNAWLNHFQWYSPLVSELHQYHGSLAIYSLKELAVSGKHILKWCNKPAGAWVKELLHHLFIAVAAGKLPNSTDYMKEYILTRNEGDGSNEQP